MDRSAEQSTERDLPTGHTWFAGRRWLGVVFALLSAAQLVLVVLTLADGPVDGARAAVSVGVQAVLVVAWAVMAIIELTSRITVDGEGVHRHTVFRRRTDGWEDIADVRPPAGGSRQPVLVRRDGTEVVLPNGAGQLHTLRRERYRPA